MSVASLNEKINDLDVVEIKPLDFDFFWKVREVNVDYRPFARSRSKSFQS